MLGKDKVLHFFISYAKADTRTLASLLYKELNNLDGVSAWMDTSLRPAKSWAKQIEREIFKADYLIVLISEDVNRDPEGDKGRSFVLKEIDFAQQIRKPIIPILTQDTYLPVQIVGDQYINFASNPNMGMQQLLNEVNMQMSDAIPVVKPRQKAPALVATPKPKPSSSSTRIPFYAIVGIVAVFILVIGFIALSNSPDDEPISTATDNSTSDFTEVADNPDLSVFEQLQTAEAEQTQAIATQAVINQQATQQAIINANATGTAQQLQATETLAQATLIALSATPTPTNTPTHTPIPSNTPIPPTPMPTLSPLDLAKTPVTSNANWTPHEQDFDGVTMVLVPAGQFVMGSTEEEIDYAVQLCNDSRVDGDTCERSWFEDEAPNGDNSQTFTEPFWIDKYEVSRAQYQECVDATICSETPDSAYSTEPNQPINRVTWFQATEYCEYRNAELPTEVQWEYASRGPDNLIYPWGSEWNENNAVFSGNSDSQTANVGSRPNGKSWVEAMDMSGNVWEWVSSLYENYPYYFTKEPDNSNINNRVVRGGSFVGTMDFLRSAIRVSGNPSFDYVNIGFRCVRS